MRPKARRLSAIPAQVFTRSEQAVQTKRFCKALHQALVRNRLSQRDLCEALGIVVGTLSKYLGGEIAPLRVGFGIQVNLARVLGVTTDALYGFYVTGTWETAISLDEVESWIRSQAGQETLPVLMSSLQQASQRWAQGGDEVDLVKESEPPAVVRYDWPQQELDAVAVSERMRQRLGLSAEALERLAVTGEFDDELAEAFSIACNYEFEAVVEAFKRQRPIV